MFHTRLCERNCSHNHAHVKVCAIHHMAHTYNEFLCALEHSFICVAVSSSPLRPWSAAQIEQLGDSSKQDVDIAAFFGRYDDALEMYEECGRLDLALQLFMRLGQVERAEAILKVRGAMGGFQWENSA